MVYTYETHITSVKNVETFFHQIVFERRVYFHSDNMFEDCVNFEGGINTFALDVYAIYNCLTDECFKDVRKKWS